VEVARTWSVFTLSLRAARDTTAKIPWPKCKVISGTGLQFCLFFHVIQLFPSLPLPALTIPTRSKASCPLYYSHWNMNQSCTFSGSEAVERLMISKPQLYPFFHVNHVKLDPSMPTHVPSKPLAKRQRLVLEGEFHSQNCFQVRLDVNVAYRIFGLVPKGSDGLIFI
jgi:hypothetical protein